MNDENLFRNHRHVLSLTNQTVTKAPAYINELVVRADALYGHYLKDLIPIFGLESCILSP
jgi:hypothetical protein